MTYDNLFKCHVYTLLAIYTAYRWHVDWISEYMNIFESVFSLLDIFSKPSVHSETWYYCTNTSDTIITMKPGPAQVPLLSDNKNKVQKWSLSIFFVFHKQHTARTFSILTEREDRKYEVCQSWKCLYKVLSDLKLISRARDSSAVSFKQDLHHLSTYCTRPTEDTIICMSRGQASSTINIFCTTRKFNHFYTRKKKGNPKLLIKSL